MIHCENGSVSTAARSVRPVSRFASAKVCSVDAGVMRSTMVQGKLTSSSMKETISGSRSAANSSIRRRSTLPLDGRLSQLSTVKGGSENA